MTASASYTSSIKKSGISTAFTGETMSNTTGNSFRIDDVNKRIFDRDATFTFYEDAVAILESDIVKVDYLFGTVEFATAKTGVVTVDGSYMPVTDIAGAKDYTLNIGSTILDVTDLATTNSNGGYRTKKYGLLDASVSLTRFDDISQTFYNVLTNRETVVIEINPANSDQYIRGWFKLESEGLSGDINGLEEESLTFQLSAGNEVEKSFSIQAVT
jgi:hypothetical protein